MQSSAAGASSLTHTPPNAAPTTTVTAVSTGHTASSESPSPVTDARAELADSSLSGKSDSEPTRAAAAHRLDTTAAHAEQGMRDTTGAEQATQAHLLPTTRLDLKVGDQSITPYDRYAQVVRVAGIDVVNLHPTPLGFFGHSYEQGEGTTHAAEISEAIRSLIDGPAVVAADLNTDRPTRVYQDLFDEMNMSPALESGARTVPGWDGAPDQVYSSPQLQAANSRIELTETDHYLVWTDLTVTDPRLLDQLSQARQAQRAD
jgi:hypothetical protein